MSPHIDPFEELAELFLTEPDEHAAADANGRRASGSAQDTGGTVVHVSAGVSALVAALVLGPRRRNGKKDGPHNVPFVVLGASLL